MAKFIQIQVGAVLRTFTAENIIAFDHPSATTTTIIYNSAQASFDTLTITHTSQVGWNVENAVRDAVFKAHSNGNAPNMSALVSLPIGITVSGVAFS